MRDSKSAVNKKYGIAFNEERKRIGLRPVDENMNLTMNVDIPLYTYSSLRHAIGSPSFLSKTLSLDPNTGELSIETDYYDHPLEKKQLTYQYWFKTNRTIIRLIDSSYAPEQDELSQLSLEKADSVLKAWDIQLSRRPK